MALTGGDRTFGHGDELTVTNAEGSTVYEGQLVRITGYDGTHNRPEVSLADNDDVAGDYWGVVKLTTGSGGAADGEKLSVVARGTPLVRVSGSSAVAAGDYLTTSTTAGEATNGGDVQDAQFIRDPVQLKDGNYYAAVHLE